MDAKSLSRAAPSLRPQDKKALNALFTAYIFKNAAGDIWTSCCGTHKNLLSTEITDKEYEVLTARHVPQPRVRYGRDTNARESGRRVQCPYCGAEAKVKELRYCGNRKNLWEYRRGVVLRQWRGALWAMAYDLFKGYTCGNDDLHLTETLTAAPRESLLGIYRFVPGKAEEVKKRWWVNGELTDYAAQTSPGKSGRMWDISAPYGQCSEYGTGYEVVGLDELEKSKFRYCRIGDLMGRCKPLQLLTACCFYPAQIEWLHRLGMDEAIEELVNWGVKNARAICWESNTPREFMGISVPELHEMQETCKACNLLASLKLYKKLPLPRDRRQIPACGKFADIFSDFRRGEMLWKRTVARGMKPSAVIDYLQREKATGQIYMDYLDAAEKIGLDLGNPIFLMPKNLHEKHDNATKAWEAMQDKQKLKDYYPRLKKLAERYTYCDGTYLIRPPISGEEIKQEGEALHHCVGGYADRHLNGVTTILFLRDVKRPKKPLATIEIQGGTILQIHGWDDERTPCPENPKRKDCEILYASILKPWLAWIKAGSKRDKRGLPRKIKHKERKTA